MEANKQKITEELVVWNNKKLSVRPDPLFSLAKGRVGEWTPGLGGRWPAYRRCPFWPGAEALKGQTLIRTLDACCTGGCPFKGSGIRQKWY